jgi:hypothetical protein
VPAPLLNVTARLYLPSLAWAGTMKEKLFSSSTTLPAVVRGVGAGVGAGVGVGVGDAPGAAVRIGSGSLVIDTSIVTGFFGNAPLTVTASPRAASILSTEVTSHAAGAGALVVVAAVVAAWRGWLRPRTAPRRCARTKAAQRERARAAMTTLVKFLIGAMSP